MRQPTLKIISLLMSVGLTSVFASETAPPQRELKTYSLPSNSTSADISPDERLVAAVQLHGDSTGDPAKIMTTDSVQLWDFQQARLVGQTVLRKETRDRSNTPTYARSEYIRYSADGLIIAAYIDHTIYVFQASNLREIRRIQTSGPPQVTHTYKTKSGPQSYTVTSSVAAFELSPVTHEAAVVWVRGIEEDSWIDIVNLDSGEETVWSPRERGFGVWNPTAVAWTSDGNQLVVAIPNQFPCNHPGSEPDVFVVQPLTGEIQNEFTTGLLVGDIAVTPDGRVLAVDKDCIGLFANHHPPLRVFDLGTGKMLKEVYGRGSGVRYVVSASQDGSRVAAYTSILKPRFDWLDMAAYGVTADPTFSVWNLKNYEGLVTSQRLSLSEGMTGPIHIQGSVPMRISPKGRFLVQGTNIYELP